MANPFVHVEINTTDVGKAKTFYGKLFDWKLEDVPMGTETYTMIRVGDGIGGGLMKRRKLAIAVKTGVQRGQQIDHVVRHTSCHVCPVIAKGGRLCCHEIFQQKD